MDRYALIHKLGEGGMGVVYSAYDRELDRKVAIKLVRSSEQQGEHSRARMIREAKTLARLSHPHIVHVYDVGVVDGQVFVAMEYVAGCTLREWVDRDRRSWSEILAMYVQAGRGLAAVHAAGVVHRDFKADNVLIGPDDRARVADFGLARILGHGDAEPAPPPGPDASGSDPTRSLATRTGALLGTPAYMSPEQHCGLPAEARSDLFSFCAALFESLHGVRPFSGSLRQELALQAIHGDIRSPPRNSRVPQRVRRALLRGLAVDPDNRWPGMDALLDELARALHPWHRRWLLAATLIVAGAGLGLALGLFARQPDAPCSGAAQAMARAWNPEVAGRVQATVLRSDLPHAATVWSGVAGNLGAYTDAWVEQYTGACESHLRGEQSQRLFDLRMDCLRRRLVEVDALVRVLADDPSATEFAVQATAQLPPLDRCGDERLVLAETELPIDAGVSAEVEALQGRLATVRALVQIAKFEVARAHIEEIVTAAEALAYHPLIAEARLWKGRIAYELAHHKEATDELLAAWWTAQTHRDDLTAVEAALSLGEQALALAQIEPVRVWAGNAQAVLDRHGSDAGLQAQLYALQGARLEHTGLLQEALDRYQQALALQEKIAGDESLAVALALWRIGRAHSARGDHETAQVNFERGLALHERLLGPEHPATAQVLNSIATTFSRGGQYGLAVAYFEQALAILTKTLGAGHPRVAGTLNNLGNVLLQMGAYDRALVSYRQALAIKEATLGPDNPSLATTLDNMGQVYEQRSQIELAEEHYQRALKIYERAHGREHVDVANALAHIAGIRAEQGRGAEAKALWREALAMREKIGGPDQMDIARLAQNLGEMLVGEGSYGEARVQLQRAVDTWERLAGPEHHEIADALVGLAAIERAGRNYPAAVSLLTRAVALREAADGSGPALAAARFELGRALWEEGSERPRATRLIRLAEAGFSAGAEGHQATAKELAAWNASRR